MNVVIQSRTFGAELAVLPVAYEVKQYSHAAVGGPKAAVIDVTGPELDLWAIIDRLRCPVKIYADTGDCVWWGYVASVQVQSGALTIDITVDSMHNRVAVAYQDAALKSRATTAWGANADSVAEYGMKELLYSGSSTSAAAAAAIQAILLDQQKYPVPGMTQSGPQSGDAVATLTCRGWWDTLGWQYAAYPSALGPGYATTSAAEQTFGNGSTSEKVVQQFTVPAGGIKAVELQVYARKQGAPLDNLLFGIFALDISGNPTGSVLYSGSIPGASVGSSLAWIAQSVTEVPLTAGTQYGLVVYRSGAQDGVNYYAVGVNTALGFAGGGFKIQNGSSSWVARAPDADMNFQMKINAQVEISSQISTLISNYGQFMIGTDVAAASGVIVDSYRNGDTTTLVEVAALLEMGGPNGKRYLTQVDVNRRLLVYEEPGTINVAYTIGRAGVMSDAYGSPIRKEQCPVGVYLRLKDVIPSNVNVTRLADPSLIFIEESEYFPGQDGLQITPRGMPTINDLGKVRNA